MTLTRDSLVVDGRRVSVNATTLTTHGTGHGREAKPALRFDKVVIRVSARLHDSLDAAVPAGMTVLVTITAPIRLAAKTAGAIDERARALIARGSAERTDTATLHGNRVRIQILKHGFARGPKTIVFVHNPGTDARLLFNMTREWLDLVRAVARRRDARRGLVVLTARHSACLDTYRYIYSQMRAATNARKILMVFSDARAELVTTGHEPELTP